jgi:hypothetical protein
LLLKEVEFLIASFRRFDHVYQVESNQAWLPQECGGDKSARDWSMAFVNRRGS